MRRGGDGTNDDGGVPFRGFGVVVGFGGVETF